MIGVIDAGMVDDDVENASQDVSSTVILSNDVFLNRAAYQLSPARFSPRGYTGSQELKYINGVEFNDQNRGVFNYASVGALNDMTRNGDVTNFTAPSTFTFGALGGAENINMRASSYTPGGKATVSYTNRNYYLRGMFTYSTGLNEKGMGVYRIGRWPLFARGKHRRYVLQQPGSCFLCREAVAGRQAQPFDDRFRIARTARTAR